MASGEQRPGGTPSARIYLLILLSTAFWGGTPVAGKLAIRDIPPMTVGVLRYGLASLVLPPSVTPIRLTQHPVRALSSAHGRR